MSVAMNGIFGKLLACSTFLLSLALVYSPAYADDLSSLVKVTKSERSLTDRRTMTVTTTATVTITNSSTQSILNPVHAVFEISSPGVRVLDAIAPGTGNPYGKYYVNLSPRFTSGGFSPSGAVSFTVRLVCPSTVRYSYKVLIFGSVGTANLTPTANAGSNRTVTIPYGQTTVNVTLDGSGSRDSDGSITKYVWSGTPDPADVVQPTVTVGEGTYTFSLIVTDDKGAVSSSSAVIITAAKEVVRPPQITFSTPPPYTAATGAASPLTINVSAASPDGRPVTLAAAPFLTNAAFTATNGLVASGAFNFAPAYGQQGKYVVTFTVRDSYGLTDTKAIQVDVSRTNRPPILTLQETASGDEGKQILIPVIANDPDGDFITLSASGLPANALFIPATGTLSFIPGSEQSGTYPVTVAASDGVVSVQKTVTMTVNDVPSGSGATPLILTVDPVERLNFLPTQLITGRVNSLGSAQPAQKTALITGLDPTGGEQGATLSVVLTGDVGAYATHFAAGSSTLSCGDGITVKKLTVTGPTSATAEILIDPAASTGIRQVLVTTGSETALSVNAFSVLKGTTAISGRLTDESGNPLANATIVIQGTNQTATTDANGNFNLMGAAAGDQKLMVSAANHEVITLNVNPQVGTNVDLGNLNSASTVYDPASAPTLSLLSVIGRGATRVWPDKGKSSAKKTIIDTVFLVGGSDAGVLDDFGNQQNPEVTGNGVVSLTSKGVDVIADRMMAGELTSLSHLLFSASFGFQWGGVGQPIPLEQWLNDLQNMVNQAWQDPTNPDNWLPLIIFNSANSLSPDPPTLSYLTALNPLQTFLFTNSLLAYMSDKN